MAHSPSPSRGGDTSDPTEPFVDERQPLLNRSNTPSKENPLPLKQIAALAYARICEPVNETMDRTAKLGYSNDDDRLVRLGFPCSFLSSSECQVTVFHNKFG
jgi:hypothetical protein